MAKRSYPKSVITEEFVLVNPQGDIRASLRVDESGTVLFELNGSDQTPRLSARVEKTGGAALCLLREDKAIAVSLTSQDDGASNVVITNQDGSPAFVAGTLAGGGGQIELFDSTGKRVRVLP